MDPGGNFNFQNLPNYKFSCADNAAFKENIVKWSMTDGLKLQAYSFDKPFKKYNESDFIVDFFGCQAVTSTLLKAAPTPGQTFIPLGVPMDLVKFSEMNCTLVTLELFDKLKIGSKIVRESGAIVKCMPQYIKADSKSGDQGFDIEVADNLRKFLLAGDLEDTTDDLEDIAMDVLSEAEKKEFLFALFSHLVIGGSLCQYEDSIDPYLQVTKQLYKDLIAVARTQVDAGDSNKLKVISYVYKIHFVSNESSSKQNLLFHRHHLNNFMYMIVNPLKQLCFTIYHHV